MKPKIFGFVFGTNLLSSPPCHNTKKTTRQTQKDTDLERGWLVLAEQKRPAIEAKETY